MRKDETFFSSKREKKDHLNSWSLCFMHARRKECMFFASNDIKFNRRKNDHKKEDE